MKKQCLVYILCILLIACAKNNEFNKDAHPQANRIQAAMAHYQTLTQKPWPKLEISAPIKKGSRSSVIPLVKQRLIFLQDWPKQCPDHQTTSYDKCLELAIQNFQQRHGFKVDGVLGRQTIEAFNVTPQQRLAQMAESRQQWLALPGANAAPYVLVNIPAYELQAINRGQIDLQMRVVVGEPDWQTPTLESEIVTVVLNPHWNVPVNITEKELIQKIIADPDYLKKHQLRIIESWQPGAKEVDPKTIDWQAYLGPKDLPYRLTQAPGDENALGRIKFIFPNKEHIYLHDTPIKSVFHLTDRDLSHGCIRLEKPMALLNYLSLTNPKLAPEHTEQYFKSNKTKYLALHQNMPLHIVYILSWVDEQQRVQFRPDIYLRHPLL